MAYGIVIQQKVIDAMTMRRPTQFGSIVLNMEPHELRTELKRRIKSILTINWMSTKCFIHGLMVLAISVCPQLKKFP
jgi:hypothetical protein